MSSKAYFDEIAPTWDEYRQQLFSDEVRVQALKQVELSPDTVAADLGAGSGFITEALVEQGVHVIAVDQSDEMLDIIRTKFGTDGPVETRPGDSNSLPIEDGAVDAAFANMYLHHVEEPATAIAEMARILKPGGQLIITDLDSHDFEFLRREHHDRWMGFERSAVQAWFLEAGLVDVSVGSISETCCCTTSSESNERAEVSIFLARGRKQA